MQSIMLQLAKKKTLSVIHRPLLNIKHQWCSSSSSAASALENPVPKTSIFMVDYLIQSFGFSPEKAAAVSKRLTHLKSPEQPDSVCHFLMHQGFTETEIKSMIKCCPRILCSSPENTLEPNFRALREMGLSASALTKIVLSNPTAIMTQTAMPRIKFWRDFFGGSEEALVKAFRKNNLAVLDIASKISFLEAHGLSTQEIGKIIQRIPRFITNGELLMEDKLNRAKEFGFQPGSGMFVYGLQAVCGNSREALQKKMELFKSFGWSEDDFFLALRMAPNMVDKSEMNLHAKMDFLIGELKCEPSYIASKPWVLTSSLDKRLRPRHRVLNLLELKGVYRQGQNICAIMRLTDDDFVSRYILPHQDVIPGLHDAFLAASA